MNFYLSGKVFEDGGEVYGSTGADTFSVLTGFEKSGDSTDGELETGLLRSGNGFGGLWLASASFGCTRRTHFFAGLDEAGSNPRREKMEGICRCFLLLDD